MKKVKWKKMTNKELVSFWDLKMMVKEGINAGYNYSNVKFVDGEMLMAKETKQNGKKR